MTDSILLNIVFFFSGFVVSAILSDWLHDLEDKER